MGAIRDRGLPARRTASGRRAAATFQPDPAPKAGGRPNQPADQEEKDQDEEQQQGKMQGETYQGKHAPRQNIHSMRKTRRAVYKK